MSFENLPRPIKNEIFSYLDPQSLGRCCQVSKGWNTLASKDHLWIKLNPQLSIIEQQPNLLSMIKQPKNSSLHRCLRKGAARIIDPLQQESQLKLTDPEAYFLLDMKNTKKCKFIFLSFSDKKAYSYAYVNEKKMLEEISCPLDLEMETDKIRIIANIGELDSPAIKRYIYGIELKTFYIGLQDIILNLKNDNVKEKKWNEIFNPGAISIISSIGNSIFLVALAVLTKTSL